MFVVIREDSAFPSHLCAPLSMIPTGYPPRSCRPQRKGDSILWKVWAPFATEVELVLHEGGEERRVTMDPVEESSSIFFRASFSGPWESLRYGFSLDGGLPRPDPSTVSQPEGVHELSALHFPGDFLWKNDSPRFDPKDLILYELHVGTFTKEGTFDAAIARFEDLVSLGINAIEILPVAQFPGDRNWGYDGVHLFAAQNSYGGPAGLQRFIDAAHGHGLAVILDVVFNHLGPEGNYLGEFAPYFSKKKGTPWGPGFNFDGEDSGPVRDYFLDCVWHWIHDFRLDGLRLDAVHAMPDRSAPHILTEIQEIAHTAARARNGDCVIIAESLLNDPVMVTATSEGGHGLDAEWNEDLHHAVFAWMTKEKQGKYIDYGGVDPITRVFSHNQHLTGQYSHFYGKEWGCDSQNVPGSRYVVSLQNHDHVGNRAQGDRLASLVSEAQLRLGACLTLLSPFTPMLFMGEEYGETYPFLFFCSFSDPRVIQGMRRGRKRDYELQGSIPDPQDPGSYEASKLSWDWSTESSGKLRQLYQELIHLRKIEPEIGRSARRQVSLDQKNGARFLSLQRDELMIRFHLEGDPAPLPEGRMIWRSEETSEIQKPFETIVFRKHSRGVSTDPAAALAPDAASKR